MQAYATEILGRMFPSVKWIGEEDEGETKLVKMPGPLVDALPKVRVDHLPATDPIPIDFEKTVVHIDPLDGTRNFAKGELNCVTSLFGIAVGDEADYGVVHRLQGAENGLASTYFGGKGLGLFRLEGGSTMR